MVESGKTLLIRAAGDERNKHSPRVFVFCLLGVAIIGLLSGCLFVLMQVRQDVSSNRQTVSEQNQQLQPLVDALISLTDEKESVKEHNIPLMKTNSKKPKKNDHSREIWRLFRGWRANKADELPDLPKALPELFRDITHFLDEEELQLGGKVPEVVSGEDSRAEDDEGSGNVATEPNLQVRNESRITDSKRIDRYVRQCSLGMKSRAIQNRRISATSDYTTSFHGKFGRLDETCEDVYYLGNSYGCWLPLSKLIPLEKQWLQVDLIRPRLVTGIVTQGRPKHYDQWVTSFQISCGSELDNLHKIQQDGKPKIFSGNFDRNSKVFNLFPHQFLCKYIRFHPVTWKGAVALRMELISAECQFD